MQDNVRNPERGEIKQSVCKHCGFSAEEHPVRHQIDGKYAYCGTFEPVAESVSTGEPRESLSVQKRKHYMKGGHAADFVPAARPSGPSVELPGPTGEGSSGHSWVEPAPQTSAEPCPICGSTKSPHAVGLSCHIPTPIREINEFPAAPHPVPRADGPEHPIVGPEDGSPCCEHCAKHPGSQWTLKVSQPVSVDALPYTQDLPYLLQAADDVLAEQSRLNQKFTDKQNDLFTALMPWRDVNGKFEAAQISGDAPRQFRHNHSAGSDYCPACTQPTGDATKVEEIAREIATATSACGSFNEIRRKTEAILRPYFPPASQTPDKITNDLCEIGRRVLNCLEKHRCPDGAIDEIEASMANLDRVIRKLRSSEPATPASTARTDGTKGDVMHIELKKDDLYLHGLATDHIWLMEDGPESHPIGIRLDCGDSGTVYLSRSQAKDLAEQLHKFAAPGSVPQAPDQVGKLTEEISKYGVPQAEPPKEEKL